VTTKTLSESLYLRLLAVALNYSSFAQNQALAILPFLYCELLQALRLRVLDLDVERREFPLLWRYSWSWLQPRNFAFIDRTERKL
jgi:hypothetical protein